MRASNARTVPSGALTLRLSDIDDPTTTTPRLTTGGRRNLEFARPLQLARFEPDLPRFAEPRTGLPAFGVEGDNASIVGAHEYARPACLTVRRALVHPVGDSATGEAICRTLIVADLRIVPPFQCAGARIERNDLVEG